MNFREKARVEKKKKTINNTIVNSSVIQMMVNQHHPGYDSTNKFLPVSVVMLLWGKEILVFFFLKK